MLKTQYPHNKGKPSHRVKLSNKVDTPIVSNTFDCENASKSPIDKGSSIDLGRTTKDLQDTTLTLYTSMSTIDTKKPTSNGDWRRRQSNHKTDESMKIGQSAGFFGQFVFLLETLLYKKKTLYLVKNIFG